MNNPNPFVPKGSLLEQQSQRRSSLKIAVFCVLAVSVTGLVAMLIQGCKRENPDNAAPAVETNTPAMDTNMPPMDTNPPVASMPPTNVPVVAAPPVVPPPPVPDVAPVPAAGGTYEVVSGDTLAKIAKKNGVSLRALQAANPGVDSRKLKIKQKLNLPAATTGTDAASAAGGAVPVAGASEPTGTKTYVVKSGDTLTKIAKKNHVSLKALRAANSGRNTDHIKVGDKLNLPAKAEAAAAVTNEAAAAPVIPPMPAPAPAPAPAVAPAPMTPALAPAPGH